MKDMEHLEAITRKWSAIQGVRTQITPLSVMRMNLHIHVRAICSQKMEPSIVYIMGGTVHFQESEVLTSQNCIEEKGELRVAQWVSFP
jgi:hypothetical protein